MTRKLVGIDFNYVQGKNRYCFLPDPIKNSKIAILSEEVNNKFHTYLE